MKTPPETIRRGESPSRSAKILQLAGTLSLMIMCTRNDVKKMADQSQSSEPVATAESVASVTATQTEHPKDSFDRFVRGSVTPGMNEVLEEAEGVRWTGKLKGNGDRDVAIYVPRPIQEGKPTELVYYFHGGGGWHIPTKAEFPSRSDHAKVEGTDVYKIRTGRNHLEYALDQTIQHNGNRVAIYPLSQKSRGVPGVSYDEHWMKPVKSGESFLNLNREVMEILHRTLDLKISDYSITLKGHSAGGEALRNIAQNPHPPLLAIYFVDASYSDWAIDTYQAVRGNRNLIFTVLIAVNRDYRPGKGTDKRTNDLLEVSEQGNPKVSVTRVQSFHDEINCPGRCSDPFFGTVDKERVFVPEKTMFRHPEYFQHKTQLEQLQLPGQDPGLKP